MTLLLYVFESAEIGDRHGTIRYRCSLLQKERGLPQSTVYSSLAKSECGRSRYGEGRRWLAGASGAGLARARSLGDVLLRDDVAGVVRVGVVVAAAEHLTLSVLR